MAATTGLTAENKKRAQAYLDAYENHNEGKIENLEDYVAEDVVNHDPVSGDEMEPEEQRGIEPFRRHAESILEGFPNLSFDVQDMIAEEDKVMVRLVLTGTHGGRAMGFEPTGKEIKFSSIIVYRFKDGKIIERWGESNSLGFLQQIGAMSFQAGA